MTKNPILNALAGLAYIATVAFTIFYAPMFFGLTKIEQMPEIFVGITMLSLFVFSASLMGYLFLYQPIVMVLAGERKEGTMLFLKTVAAFAVSALIFVVGGVLLTTIL
jgi:hypothetical protein